MAYGRPDYNAYEMVIRRVNLTIPSGTVSGSPASTTLDLDKGELRRIDVGFPPGCVGLVNVRVKEGTTDILPTTSGEWLGWNDIMMSFPVQYGVTADATTFTIEGYNDDDAYDHVVTLHLIEYVAR